MNDLEFKKIYGWENRETHRTVLLLDNSIFFIVEEFKAKSKTWIELSDKLKDYFKELESTDDGRKIIVQIGSLERVDFDQIAKHYLD